MLSVSATVASTLPHSPVRSPPVSASQGVQNVCVECVPLGGSRPSVHLLKTAKNRHFLHICVGCVFFFLNNASNPGSTSLPELSQTRYLHPRLLDEKTMSREVRALSDNNTLSQSGISQEPRGKQNPSVRSTRSEEGAQGVGAMHH